MGGGPKGYDKAKNVKGRKRHILVDTMGLLMRVCVHAADIQERDGAKLLLQAQAQAQAQTSWQLMWADSGYRGEPFAQWAQENCGCRLEIVKKDPQQQGGCGFAQALNRRKNFCMVRKVPAFEQRL